MDALVIIDVQQGMFALPHHPPGDGEAVVARIQGLLDRARAARKPVFFVQHAGEAGDLLARGGPGFPFRPELKSMPGERVTVKTNCSAFQGTDLDKTLQAAGVKRLIVCGMQTEFCIDTAVRAAFERGYDVILVSDGHATFDTPELKAELVVAHHNRVLGSGFAKLKPAAEIAF